MIPVILFGVEEEKKVFYKGYNRLAKVSNLYAAPLDYTSLCMYDFLASKLGLVGKWEKKFYSK